MTRPSPPSVNLPSRRWISPIAGLLLGLMAGAVVAAQPDDSMADRIVAGHTLAEWRVRMKNLDPQDATTSETVPGLIELIADRTIPGFTRRQAALTLGRMGATSKSAVPVLLGVLEREPEIETRHWVLKALTLFGAHAAEAAQPVGQLVHLQETDHLLQVAALEALARFGAERPGVLSTLSEGIRGTLPARNEVRAHELRIAAVDVASILGVSAAPLLPDLLRAAEDDDPLLRLAAVTTIGRIGPLAEIAIPQLGDLVLLDDEPVVQDAAATALGQIGPSSMPVLRELAGHPDIEVRQRALLGAIAMPVRGAELISLFLDDPDCGLRVRAAGKLLSHPQWQSAARDALFVCLADPQPRVQRSAYETFKAAPLAWSRSDPRWPALLNSPQATTAKLAARLLELDEQE